MAYTHTELRTAGALIIESGCITPATLAPFPHRYRRSDGMPRMHAGASLCTCASYSGRPWGDKVLEVAGYRGVPG